MVTYIRSDLDFILQQILIAEAHAAGADLTSLLPNSFVPFGLRTVDGSFNNVVTGQSEFGASDNLFPRMTDPVFNEAEAGTTYDSTGMVIDSQPRTISNLIVDQTITNPAAVAAFVEAGSGILVGGVLHYLNDDGSPGDPVPPGVTLGLPNSTPDEGLSAGFNLWFVFFGQFFDHGLDLVQKGGNEIVYIPLNADDPLITHGPDGIPLTGDELTNPALQFMVITRATQFEGPGADGILADDLTTLVDEAADNTFHEAKNITSPFVDQNQTYTSTPSHQVFLRAYELNGLGQPVATGKLITNKNLGDNGAFGGTGADADIELGGMATWAVVKAQARDLLGIQLTDYDAVNVPLVRVDPYGNFIPDPTTGFAQIIVDLGADGIAQTDDDVLLAGDPTANGGLGVAIPITAPRTGNPFLADIAHSANPFSSQTGLALAADGDDVIGDDGDPNTYDDELLAEHFMAGDGRVNENIGLTAVHHIFHAEHNRLVEHTQDVALDDAKALFNAASALPDGTPEEAAAKLAAQETAISFLNEWLVVDVTTATFNDLVAVSDLTWDGERLFQAAKFGTEMQYQHLVFEEFARKVQPMVDVFLAPEGFDAAINPAIVAEFAHTVYRFGHSMLLETIDRLDPTFVSSEIGLITAFLNPLAFDANGTMTPEEAAGAIVRGTTRQLASEIDEFKVEALRNNLLGLPLDLAAVNLARGRDTGIPSLNAARREFYDMTSDSQLTPYASWVDFMANMRHPESLVNFIAAYGTHLSITSVGTLAEKRAAADLLVFGGVGEPVDRLDFLYSTGAYTTGADGVIKTGLDDVDFWIGGLAEKQMPFGGLLGSTFNFVFETQLESLQNGDRFYYLARTAGMHFITELEDNSFAKLIMLHTDTKHLPADVFSTPAFILEVNPLEQFTGLGLLGQDDPTGGTSLIPLVIRDDPSTPGVDTHYLRYTGVDHVVLGGTAGNDTLIASIGDDTIWGDGGNDRIEGGDGVDNVEGGAGDDIITDKGGDDVLKGNEGNDVIHGGNGFNLLLGGAGSDFIITGEDVSETFGGTGNDFIFGAQMNLPTFGNEGDDWIEIGTSDGAGGDNFDPQEAGTVIGHDVFITGGGFDEADGEGGDDIMVFSDGEDHFGGGGGFDWASYKNDPFGVTADLLVNDLVEPPVTPSNQGILDRFAQVEGLAGSAFSDILRGDDADAAEINTGDAQDSSLNQAGIDRISGLQDLLGAGVTTFFSGNIILGGAGSDIIEGRGGDDLIDGDRTLNVRVRVNGTDDPDNPGNPYSFDSIGHPTLLMNMLNGTWNPSQLEIVREILAGATGFDTAVFSGRLNEYSIVVDDNVLIGDTSDDIVTVTDLVAGRDGVDVLKHIERLQFSPDEAGLTPEEITGKVVLVPGLNAEPAGLATIDDTAPASGQTITASIAGVTDADNVSSAGAITGRVAYFWQVERDPVNAPGVFEDIVALGGGNPATAAGSSFQVTADLAGLALRVKVVYQDENGVLETVFSDATDPVVAGAPAAPAAALPIESETTSPGGGIHLIRADLQFILDQILIAKAHPDGNVLDSIANTRLPFGLRTVDGTFNNLLPGQTNFGAADQNFPLLLEQNFRNEGDDTFDPDGPGGPAPNLTNNNYAATTVNALGETVTRSVIDADPRIISNLIVDQTITNPVAVQAFVDAGFGILVGGVLHYLEDDGITPGAVVPPFTTLTLPNTTPDEGLSAGFNTWFTFFGQFFDHGLDLVDKGGQGTVFMPLQEDDPLFVVGGSTNFMVLTRATNTAIQAGEDLILGTSDDVHFHNNETTPFVDQNQTYTSNASHQVFLREYAFNAAGDPVNTGRLIDGANGGIANWAEVKAQAAAFLGIQLTDFDIHDVPLLATDAYGQFISGASGFAQFVTTTGLVEADPAANLGLGTLVPANALRTGHAFLNDIAHHAAPGTFDDDGNPGTPGIPQVADSDAGPEGLFGDDLNPATYDDELLGAHFVTGDGRGNENIGLTSVHFIFHAEHNRLVGHIKDVAIASNDASFANAWLLTPISQGDLDTINALDPIARAAAIDALNWNGEYIFQAARFSTEMQYQHLVFEEFARKVQPQVDVFLAEGQGYDSTINPAIVAEFAHVVYRFGHSLLPDTVDRLDANFALVNGDAEQIGLIEAFLNPLEFTASGATDAEAAGAIIRGVTRQAGNEIDEFVTEAVRNNLLGLPLDLPAINLARGRDTGVPPLNAARAQFYSWTGDSQLKPYTSWVDLASNLKHEASLVNFVAAYGTHESITDELTTAGKRAAAYALVYGEGGMDGDLLTLEDNPTVAVPTDRLDFLNSTGDWANDSLIHPTKDVDSVTTTGLGSVDLWIGGLAEKQMPFGGLLGSTFNYVFENQMEKLQNGDRFYYLERTAGLNFLTELENNSFAKLIMANTDTTHLPGDVFSTPAFTLEVDQSKQFTGIVAPQQAIGEAGTIDVTQIPSDATFTVDFAELIPNAVVVLTVNTTGDSTPVIARLIGTSSTGFTFQLQEWVEGGIPVVGHGLESVSWVAIQAGEHTLPDGTIIKAGFASANDTFDPVAFATPFDVSATPTVLTQVSSTNDLVQTVTTRQTSVTETGFSVRVQEREANAPAHNAEIVGWIAINQAAGTSIDAGTTGSIVDHVGTSIAFDQDFGSPPVFLAQMQTENDTDTATVRGTALSGTSATVFVEEEQSAEVDVTHAPAENVGYIALGAGVIFSTPPVLNGDPTGDNPLLPLVIRNNPTTPGLDANYLRYTGEDHVVLGGTAGNDTIISSIGDDTLYGDAGNDRLEGGDGVDMILGGAGDDIITDRGGDDNLQGQDGNDAIHGGNGINLILGGFGNDFIVTGEDESEAFGGGGNDFIMGVKPVEMLFGNEGDDWLEHGLADGSAGENFDTRGLDAIIGNDVFIGDTIADRMLGEGGDDIMMGNGGQVDRYIGASGFDWALFKSDEFAANADLNLRAFDETPLPQSAASTLARYESTEGLSGSSLSDILRGDDADAVAIAASGFTGSILTNFDLVAGLRDFVAEAGDGADGAEGGGDDQFGAGNIILGGDGSDIIEGRGGDDLIDGDLALNVRISWRSDVNDPDTEIESFNNMAEMQARVFSGEINPGQLVIVREILPGTPGAFNFDTAQYSGNLADYTIIVDDGGTVDNFADDIVTVTHVDAAALNGIGIDGVDRLTHVERLQFNDQAVVLVPNLNNEPVGNLTISLVTPTGDVPITDPNVGQLLRVSSDDVADADNVNLANPDGLITEPVTYVWQFEPRPGTGLFEDIVIATGLGDMRATGETFLVTPDLDGLALRVRAIYQDAKGVLEQVFSNITDPVVGGGVGNAPVAAALTTFAGADGAIEDTVFNGTLAGLAIDPNGDAVTFSIDLDSPDGDIVLDPNGAFTFTPNADFFGTTSFTFIASDGVLDSNVGTVEIVVANVDDAPEVGDPAILGPLVEDTQLVISAAQLLANVTDIDNTNALGELVGVQIFNLVASSGTITPAAGSSLAGPFFQGTFTPDADDQTDVTFTYDVSSNGTTLVPHEATMDLLPANDVPVGVGLGANAVAEFAANGTLVGTLSAFDADGDPLTFTLLDSAGGRFVLAGNQLQVANSILLDFEQAAAHTIMVRASDGVGFTDQSFTINVTDINPEILTGTAIGDTIFGGAGADRFNGAGGNDVLRGNVGADRIVGGAGNDRIVATIGDGNDRYDGGAGIDVLDLSLTTAGAIVNLGATTITSAQIGTDRIANFERVIGSQGNDTLTGTVGTNFLDGQGGNDQLNGGTGADTILGGGGFDSINGGTGNDTITGGTGGDIMNGGTGNDRFIFAAGFGNDVISQFDANPAGGGQDRLDISAFSITASNFGVAVDIDVVGFNTQVTIAGQTITLIGVGGFGGNALTQADFILAP